MTGTSYCVGLGSQYGAGAGSHHRSMGVGVFYETTNCFWENTDVAYKRSKYIDMNDYDGALLCSCCPALSGIASVRGYACASSSERSSIENSSLSCCSKSLPLLTILAEA